MSAISWTDFSYILITFKCLWVPAKLTGSWNVLTINGLPSAEDRRICGFSRYSDRTNGKNIKISSTRGCLGLRSGAVASGTWRRVADPETSAASDLLTRRHTPERRLHFTHSCTVQWTSCNCNLTLNKNRTQFFRYFPQNFSHITEVLS
jgi:hypothetical protein